MTIIEQLEKRKKLLAYLNSPSNEEVFTPAKLVEEMLDKLPKEIWTDPNLLWCDPCAKSGVFMLEVVLRLMKNIAIENETERYKHIINNMVKAYVNVERNKWLVSKMVYGSKDSVNRVGIIKDINKINIEDMPKFDVVVGNPPFQAPKREKSLISGKKNLYQQFISKSLDILNKDGYLLFISPPGFMKSTNWGAYSPTFEKIMKYNFKYLKLSGVNKFFKVGTPICYFLIQNNSDYTTTLINDEFTINFKEKFFMPLSDDPIVFSIFDKVSNLKNGINFNFVRDGIKHKNSIYLFRLDQSTGFPAGKIENMPIKKRDIITYTTSVKRDIVIKTLNSKLFSFIRKMTKYDPVIYHKFLNGLKHPVILFTNDKELYKLYDLSKEEIDYIESQVK